MEIPGGGTDVAAEKDGASEGMIDAVGGEKDGGTDDGRDEVVVGTQHPITACG